MCKKIAFFLLFSFFKRRFTFVDCWTSLVPHVPVMVVRIHSKGFMLPAKHCACEERQRALASGWADKGTLRISLSHFSSRVGKHLGHGHIILGGVWSLGISRMLTDLGIHHHYTLNSQYSGGRSVFQFVQVSADEEKTGLESQTKQILGLLHI